MKSKITRRIAMAILFLSTFTVEMFPQAAKYSGDGEIGMVATQKYATAQIGVATSHGAYFVKPQLFVGAGASVGFNVDADYYNTIYPIYGDIRKDFAINRLFTAFIDAKAGYTFNGKLTENNTDSRINYGFYCYPSAGLRVKTSERCGIYLKVGYTYQDATLTYMERSNTSSDGNSQKYNAGGFSVSVGFSF